MHLIFRHQQGYEPGVHEHALHFSSIFGVERGCSDVRVFVRRNVGEFRMGRAGKSPERGERLPACRRGAWRLHPFESVQLDDQLTTLIGRERPGCVQDGGDPVHDLGF